MTLYANKDFQKALSSLVDTIRQDTAFPEQHTVEYFAPTGGGTGVKYLEISIKTNPTVKEYSRQLLAPTDSTSNVNFI